MNDKLRPQALIATVACGLVMGVLSIPAHAGNRCDSPTVGAEARACAASRQGPEALRRFIARTRAVYGLSYWDFKPAETPPLAQAEPGPAVAVSSTNPSAGSPRASQ